MIDFLDRIFYKIAKIIEKYNKKKFGKITNDKFLKN